MSSKVGVERAAVPEATSPSVPSLILDSLGEGVYGLDLEGRTTFVNRAATEMTGWDALEMAGEPQHALLHHTRQDGSPYPAEQCPIHQTLRDGQVRRVEGEVFWRKDGSPFPVVYTATPVVVGGEITGAVVVFRDVTHQMEMLSALERQEEHHRALLDALPDAIIRLGRDGSFRDVRLPEGFNPDASPADALNMSIDNLPDRQLVEVVRARIEEAVVSGQMQQFEYEMEVAGQTRVREVRLRPSGPDEVVAVVRDITQQKHANRQRERSEQMLAGIAGSAQDGIMALEAIRDERGDIVDFRWMFANPRAKDFTRREPNELVGRSLLSEMPEIKDDDLFADYIAVVETGQPRERDLYYEHDGVEAYFHFSAVKLGDGLAVTMRDETESRTHQEQLVASQRQLARAQKMANLGSWQWDPQEDELVWSEALYHIFGLKPSEEISFDRYLMMVHPEDRQDVQQAIETALEKHSSFAFEDRILLGNGCERILSTAGEVVEDEDGYVTVMGVCQDITEARAAEQELRQSEMMLARAQRLARLGSWEWDIASDNLLWSTELYRIYGLEPGQPVSFDQYLKVVHPADRERVQKEIKGALEEKRSMKFHHRIIRSDGDERVMQAEGEVLLGRDGNVVRMYGTSRDVTEMRRAEEQVRQSEQRFRRLAEQMTDLLSLHDPDGTYVYVSPSAERILGYESHEMIGLKPTDLIHPEDISRHGEQILLSSTASSESGELILRMRTKSGDWVWLEFLTTVVTDEQGEVLSYQASARDVSARVEAQQAAARSASILAQRNRELQDFAYVASHDLQEPLRKIRAFADLLNDDYSEKLDADGSFYLQRIQDSATRMSTLISDLLAFSRIATKAKPYEKLDLNEIAEDVISDLEYLVKDVGGRVEVGELPHIEADRTQMRQLIQNLTGNALKFRRRDVPPVVSITASEDRRVLHPGMDEEQVVELTVADNGIGFNVKYLDRIFTPFQRLHSRDEYAGTGMGLAICRRIVERHGGTISATSTPGQGSTFVVRLPKKHSEIN